MAQIFVSKSIGQTADEMYLEYGGNDGASGWSTLFRRALLLRDSIQHDVLCRIQLNNIPKLETTPNSRADFSRLAYVAVEVSPTLRQNKAHKAIGT